VSDRVEKFRYEGETAERVDKFLVSCLPEFSRARLQGLIDDGYVSINNSPVRKSGQIIEAGAQVEVHVPPHVPSRLTAENIALDIIFENSDLIVVNKPAGMVVHPAVGHDSGTLVHAVLGHDPQMEGIGGEERPGVVHRLDKETSGLILLAKNERAHRWLQDQFRLRQVDKTYLALVDGKPPALLFSSARILVRWHDRRAAGRGTAVPAQRPSACARGHGVCDGDRTAACP